MTLATVTHGAFHGRRGEGVPVRTRRRSAIGLAFTQDDSRPARHVAEHAALHGDRVRDEDQQERHRPGADADDQQRRRTTPPEVDGGVPDGGGSAGAGGNGGRGGAGGSGTGGRGGSGGGGGTAGATGGAGASGSAGTTGTAGRGGASGSAGAAGTSGSAGTSGTAGATGVAGSVGTAGTTGGAGTSGSAGTTGAAGSSAPGSGRKRRPRPDRSDQRVQLRARRPECGYRDLDSGSPGLTGFRGRAKAAPPSCGREVHASGTYVAGSSSSFQNRSVASAPALSVTSHTGAVGIGDEIGPGGRAGPDERSGGGVLDRRHEARDTRPPRPPT